MSCTLPSQTLLQPPPPPLTTGAEYLAAQQVTDSFVNTRVIMFHDSFKTCRWNKDPYKSMTAVRRLLLPTYYWMWLKTCKSIGLYHISNIISVRSAWVVVVLLSREAIKRLIQAIVDQQSCCSHNIHSTCRKCLPTNLRTTNLGLCIQHLYVTRQLHTPTPTHIFVLLAGLNRHLFRGANALSHWNGYYKGSCSELLSDNPAFQRVF